MTHAPYTRRCDGCTHWGAATPPDPATAHIIRECAERRREGADFTESFADDHCAKYRSVAGLKRKDRQ